jgi:hypothetical protein
MVPLCPWNNSLEGAYLKFSLSEFEDFIVIPILLTSSTQSVASLLVLLFFVWFGGCTKTP